MELIPILSTIILVATISTFLLSIGAYVLYKIRERKNTPVGRQAPKTVQAELVVPADVIPGRVTMQDTRASQYQSPFSIQKPAPEITADRNAGQEPEPKRFTVEKSVSDFKSGRGIHKKVKDTKYFKYTSEGYVPTEEDKVQGAVKWR